MPQHTVESHAERVAEGIKSDKLRMSHVQTLQKLYLSRTNEMHLERQQMHLERQLDSERKACEALRAEAKELRKELAKQTKVHAPKVCGQALRCSECGQPVDFVPYTMRPRYQYCRWCGAKLRRQ